MKNSKTISLIIIIVLIILLFCYLTRTEKFKDTDFTKVVSPDLLDDSDTGDESHYQSERDLREFTDIIY
tara:strand:+ start:103 stop:309 length:207 start_codon:yes stop_codon:yes gene_type:complete